MRIILGNKKIFNTKIETDEKLFAYCPFIYECAGCWNSDLALAIALVVMCWIHSYL